MPHRRIQHVGGFLLCGLFLLAGAAQTSVGQSTDKRSVTATVTSSRQQVYENEVFTLTLTITAAGAQIGQAIDYLSGPEGEALKLGAFQELPDKTEQKDGVVRRVRQFRVEARALQRGPLRVSPQLTVRLVERKRTLVGSMWQETPRRIQAQPLDLMVLPVPTQGRPENWSSAIGAYSFSAMAGPRTVAAGDLVTVRMVVRGKGYREDMEPPRVSPGRHFKAYDPKRVSDSGDEAVFEQIVIPQSTNAASIPPVSFCFFHPISGRYKTVRQGPFALTFRKKAVRHTEVFRPKEPQQDAMPSAQSGTHRTRESMRRTLLILGAGLALALSAVGLTRLIQRRWAAAAAALGATGVLVLAMIWVSRSEHFASASSIVQAEATARFAPSDSAMTLFSVGEGDAVRIVESAGAWVRIRRADDSGWVPAAALLPR